MKKIIIPIPALWLAATLAAPAGAQDQTPAPAPAPTTAAPDEARIIEQTNAYNAGLEALKKNDLTAAGTSFQRVVALNGEDAQAQMFLGYVRLKQERYEDAATALEAARRTSGKLAPKTQAEIHNNLGIAYWNKNRQVEAVTAYQKALDLNPDYTEARYNLAFALLARSRWKKAAPHLSQLATQNPRDAALFDGLGEAQENIGDWVKALGAYKKATELDGNNSAYQLHLALALVNTGRKDEAIKYLKEAKRLDPQNAPAYLQLGVIYLEQARQNKAIKWSDAQDELSRYVALQPNDFIGRYNLGVAYDFDAKFGPALTNYAEAEHLKPDDPAVKNNIGRIYFKRKEYPAAVNKLNEALRVNPNFYDARHNLALVLTEQSKLSEKPDQFDEDKLKAANDTWRRLINDANKGFKAATEKDQQQNLRDRIVAAEAGLAENYLNARRYDEAAAEYDKLLAIDPNNVPALSNLGLALYYSYTAAKDKATAAPRLARAAEIYRDITINRDQKNAVAHNNLGVILEAQNDKANALASYKKAVELKADYKEAQDNIKRLTDRTAIG